MADDNLAVSFQEAPSGDTEFDAIHDAFMETGRGRWFLNEYSRRNRHADTALLLAAIGRIESILLAQRAASSLTQQVANPAGIKPEAELKGNSTGNSEAAQIAADSAARLRASIAPLRDVAWSLREQGDMRADVIERQAVEFAEAATLFEVLRARLEAADAQTLAPEPALVPVAETAASDLSAMQIAPAPQSVVEEMAPQPEPEAAQDTPPPLRTFATMPLLETIPAPGVADIVSERTDPAASASKAMPILDPQLLLRDEPEFTFQDLFEQTAAASEAAKAAAAKAKTAIPIGDEPAEYNGIETASADQFASSQEQRLSRLIHIFAGSHDAERLTAPAESTQPAPLGASELGDATPEPADFVLEPWPRVSATAPASMAQPVSAANRKTSSHSRTSPHDPLAPIIALSVEEKIALFS